ncbi:MAG TPA: hypothetical protein VN699_21935 [Pirellulales bacterium]|nr:hypothetical protein [Pirellulales bacterium]
MSHRNLLAACPFAAMVLAALASPSQAQFKKPEPTPYDGKGTVEAVGFEGIQFKDADGKTIVVGFDFKTKPKVTVTGTAEPGFLAPGLIVRFSAKMTSKGQVKDPIGELAVIETSELNQIGAQPDLAPGEDLKKAEKEGPVEWVVVGAIRSVKKNQLQIAAGGKAIKAEVAEDCKITVDVSDLSIVQAGDEISVVGKQLPGLPMGDGAQSGQVIGEKIDVVLAKPLTAPGKKKGAKAKPKSSRTKKPAASEE